MSSSARSWERATQDRDASTARPVARSISATTRRLFLAWTIAWWGGVGVCGALFFFGVLDFAASAKLSLYGISIWLNGWVLASFGSVDLRTVNHDSTFYVVEIFSFVNVFTTIGFFHLNRKRSPYRYLIVVLGCGEPIAATFIFSFAEVFGGFENMTGGVADTLLALLWTQYQYFIFPMIFGYLGFRLLREDWRHARDGEDAPPDA